MPPTGKLTGWDIQTVPQAHFSRAALANACRLYIGFKQTTAKLKSPIQKRRGRIADVVRIFVRGAKHPFYWAALANACRLYIGFKQATAKLKSPIQKSPRDNAPPIEKGMVPKVGVEPTRPRGRQILSLVRLPFRHSGTEGI